MSFGDADVPQWKHVELRSECSHELETLLSEAGLAGAALMANTMFVLHDDPAYIAYARAAIRRRVGR
jgi:hypothetical protein